LSCTASSRSLANAFQAKDTTDLRHQKVAKTCRTGFRREGGLIRDRWSVDDKSLSVMLERLIAGEEG